MLSPASHYQFSALLTFTVNVVLLWLVLNKGTNKKLIRSFTFYCSSIIFWSFFVVLATTVRNPRLSLLFSQFCHAGATLIPLFFLHFVYTFLALKTQFIVIRSLNGMACIFLMIILLFPSVFFNGVSPKFGFPYFPNAGRLYSLWTAYFFILVGIVHLQLLKASLRSEGIKRKHLSFFFTANLIGYSGGIGCFLPVYDIAVFPFPYGPYGVVLFSLVTAYSILRYRFLDIEVIIKKTLVFAGLSSFVVACFSIPLFLLPKFFAKSITEELQLWLLVGAGMVVAGLVGPLNRILIDITDKYLFQKKINYRLLLREASEYLAHVDSLKQQARNIVAFLLKKARIANASVYAFAAPDRSALVLKASCPEITDENLERISLSHPIIEYFSKHQGPLEINTVGEMRDDRAKEELKSRGLDEILTLMKSLQAEAVIPCFGGEAVSKFDKKSSRLKGVLFLGHQKSDEPYSEEDLDVFFTLGQESSIAFENARLYDEAVNRSIELEKANEELKKTQTALMEEKKRALLAGMSSAVGHEIRSPLLPLGTHIYFSRKRLDQMKSAYEESLSNASDSSRQKFLKAMDSLYEQLSGIEICNNRIKGIVNTLLNLVRKRSEQKGPVQLELLVASAIEEVRFQTYWETLAAPKIERQIPAGLPFILGITQDLQGVFVNLIINSLHAMEKTADKKITIKARVAEDKPSMIEIEFADTGCGIPGELQEKVFEHGVTTKGEKGTGIGLFYCKDIIERVHGGAISLKSKVGEGTCFTISLPVYKEGI